MVYVGVCAFLGGVDCVLCVVVLVSVDRGDEGYCYVARFRFCAVPLVSMSVPGMSSKVVKTVIYLVPELGIVRRLYESRDRVKPFAITPLFLDGKPLVGSNPIRVEKGSCLEFSISMAIRSPDDVADVQSIDRVVEVGPGKKLRVYLKELEIVSPDSLSIGLSLDRVVRIRFLSPALLSTKLMAPPLPHFLKRVSSIRERYVLYPSSAHICCYLTKLWNKLFPHRPISRKVSPEWAAYFMGRLCEVAMIAIDYGTRPITVFWDVKRKPRGFVGWALYEIGDIGKKLVSKLDKLLALANYMGIGKSRSIGFGAVCVETVPKKE